FQSLKTACDDNFEGSDLIKPRKLPNPIMASCQHRALHQELLFCHRRCLLPRVKPELMHVLEHRQRERHEQAELARHPPSDLEVKLRMRQQRIQCELEEKRREENLRNTPEFVRVRGTLKHLQEHNVLSNCTFEHQESMALLYKVKLLYFVVLLKGGVRK
uniref:Si:ch211-160o17.6 n=1 Tax=Echeneis naucrates TaxID=173247 RepID=A0A665WWZ3_ECHNA